MTGCTRSRCGRVPPGVAERSQPAGTVARRLDRKARLHGQPVGYAIVVLFLLLAAAPAPTTAGSGDSFPNDRAALIARLTTAVIVRYQPTHNPHQEWDYNAADIDASPIVWARGRG